MTKKYFGINILLRFFFFFQPLLLLLLLLNFYAFVIILKKQATAIIFTLFLLNFLFSRDKKREKARSAHLIISRDSSFYSFCLPFVLLKLRKVYVFWKEAYTPEVTYLHLSKYSSIYEMLSLHF